VARNFDGTDDVLNLGSDASVDNIFSASPFTGTIALWLSRTATGLMIMGQKDLAGTDGWGSFFRGAGGNHTLRIQMPWSVTLGDWETTTQFSSTATPYHVVLTYDGSSTSNNVEFYVNGGTVESTEIAAPAGTFNGDSGADWRFGEAFDGTSDFNGLMGWIAVSQTIWGAEQRNRHRWWGRVGGAHLIQHPLVTDKTTNEGTGTANVTATGTTVVAFPRVQRPGGMCMMGCGI
jgi:hypothetical protein